MRFVLSFSGGKDSVLALHHMVADGHTPVALLVMYRAPEGRSWVHGMERSLLDAISRAMGIPLLCCEASGETYAPDMERFLARAKSLGAEACVFGDIDVEEHRRWDEDRCAAVGLEAFLPLWGRDREENVREAVNLGYRCLIKCVRRDVLPDSFLGQPLSLELLDQMKALNIDLCGENGEYHTAVVDGPLFRHPVTVENRGIVRLEHIVAADLEVKDG